MVPTSPTNRRCEKQWRCRSDGKHGRQDDKAVPSPTLPTALGNRQRTAVPTSPPHDDDEEDRLTLQLGRNRDKSTWHQHISIVGRGCSPKKLCGFFTETDFTATDEAVSSVRGSWPTDNEGDPSASTDCSMASTAWGVSVAGGAAGFVSSRPASGNFVVSSFDPVPAEEISSGSNELPFSSLVICDDLRPVYFG